MNIDQIKKDKSLHIVKYRLPTETLLTSKYGYLFIDHLDEMPAHPDECQIGGGGADRQDLVEYIEKKLESNKERFANQIKLVKKYITNPQAKVLDVGAGGGYFLSLLQSSEWNLSGIELSQERLAFATKQYGLNILSHPLESAYWDDKKETFDLITLWDVIEHVNYPSAILRRVFGLLKPGGYIMIDTPCRDSQFYRMGQLSYFLSRGRFPTLLKIMCSSQPYAHKQIFSMRELKREMEMAGFKPVEYKSFFELSFPIEHYMSMLVPNNFFSKILSGLATLVFHFCYIRNKMYFICQKNA